MDASCLTDTKASMPSLLVLRFLQVYVGIVIQGVGDTDNCVNLVLKYSPIAYLFLVHYTVLLAPIVA